MMRTEPVAHLATVTLRPPDLQTCSGGGEEDVRIPESWEASHGALDPHLVATCAPPDLPDCQLPPAEVLAGDGQADHVLPLNVSPHHPDLGVHQVPHPAQPLLLPVVDQQPGRVLGGPGQHHHVPLQVEVGLSL